MLVKLIHDSNIKWFRTTLYFGEADALYCAITHQVRYSAIYVHFCCWLTARQCNTVQCGKN